MNLTFQQLKDKIDEAHRMLEFTQPKYKLMLVDLASNFDECLEAYRATERNIHSKPAQLALKKLMDFATSFEQWLEIFRLTKLAGKTYEMLIERWPRSNLTFEQWRLVYYRYPCGVPYQGLKLEAYLALREKASSLEEWLVVYTVMPFGIYGIKVGDIDYSKEENAELRRQTLVELCKHVRTTDDIRFVLRWQMSNKQLRVLLVEAVTAAVPSK